MKKKKSKFEDLHLDYLLFLTFSYTRECNPKNWKKCTKGKFSPKLITWYFYWKKNFFWKNQPTSSWDTAYFFSLKKCSNKMTLKEVVGKIKKSKESSFCFESLRQLALKTEIMWKYSVFYLNHCIRNFFAQFLLMKF